MYSCVSTLVLMSEYDFRIVFGRSEIRRRIGACLVDAPGGRLHLREIARRARTSAGTAARELGRLEAAGFVARDREGRQVYFRWVAAAPAYPSAGGPGHASVAESAAALSPTASPDRLGLMVARQLHREIGAVFGPRLVDVLLFGSRARGDHDADSDVDVLIVLDEIASYPADLRASGEATSRLSLDAGVTISRLLATRSSWERRDRPILRVIAEEGIRA